VPETLIRLYVHTVWATAGRAPLVTEDLRARLYAVMQHQASRVGAEVIAIGGMADHVHVLSRIPATLTVADLVGRMKGGSSYLASQLAGLGGFRWQGGYGAFSVSQAHLPRVREYVLHQAEHHSDGTLQTALESTAE